MEKQDEKYLSEANTYMLAIYGIAIQDTGYPLGEWLTRFGDRPAAQAVIEYGEKYQLTPLFDVKAWGPAPA